MELAISKDFLDGKLTFKNAQLKTATTKIVQNMKTARKGFLTAGLELKRIQDEKLFEKDYFDADGKPSFAMYVECVLGISKSTAYRIIKTTEKLLAPEMLDEKKPAFFENFSDFTLDMLTGLGDYDAAFNFCKAFDITETTGRDLVKEYVRAYKNGFQTLAEYVEHLDSIEENKIEIEGEEIGEGEGEQIEMDDTNPELEEMRGYLEFVANLFKSDVNAAFDLVDDEQDGKKIIKEIIGKFSTI